MSLSIIELRSCANLAIGRLACLPPCRPAGLPVTTTSPFSLWRFSIGCAVRSPSVPASGQKAPRGCREDRPQGRLQFVVEPISNAKVRFSISAQQHELIYRSPRLQAFVMGIVVGTLVVGFASIGAYSASRSTLRPIFSGRSCEKSDR